MTSFVISPHWYVVRTHPRAEDKAAAHLERQGFQTYLPRYLKRRRHARRLEIVPSALFPRYLFVAFDKATQRWRSIQSTFGVAQLVCHGEEPATVGSEIVDALRAREDERGYIRLSPVKRFVPGDKVRIVDGVFSAALGLFESMTDKERVTILLDLLGRKVRVVLDVEAVAAA
jgi:transcriptional antiterminator RfaH